MRRQHGRRLTGMYPGCGPRRATLPLHGQLHDLSPSCFPGNERARSPPALLSQPSCSGQAARLRLRHLAAGPRPALCGYHESQPSRLPASEPSRRGRARSPRSHHSRAMTRTGHSLLLSRPRPTCRSSRRRPVRTPCLRSLRRAQTHRPAGGTSGRRRPLRTQPLPSAESCCCPGNERVRSSLSFLSQPSASGCSASSPPGLVSWPVPATPRLPGVAAVLGCSAHRATSPRSSWHGSPSISDLSAGRVGGAQLYAHAVPSLLPPS